VLATDPLVMVMDGHREGAFGPLLTDHMPVQFRPDFARFGQGLERAFPGWSFTHLPVQDVGAKGDAVVTNVDAGPGDEFLHLRVAFSTEGAKGEVGGAGHGGSGLF